MLLKTFKEIFGKTSIFPGNPIFLTFRHFWSNKSFWDAFYMKSALFSGFGKFQLLLHWNPSVFPKKKQKYWPLSEFLSNSTLWDALWEKITILSDFENFQGHFRKKIYRFFQKKPNFWRLWGVSNKNSTWNTFWIN